MPAIDVNDALKIFLSKLKADQEDIDEDISAYCASWLTQVNELYGEPAGQSVGSYTAILSRGGKRIRGSLAMRAYAAYGGNHDHDALLLARVLEMAHAYLLVIDDIQDNSAIRRGGPTAHVMLSGFHESEHLRGSSEHFGRSQAINGALVGIHQALLEFGKLTTPNRQALLDHLNQTLVATAMGQFYDMYNEVVETVNEAYVMNALEWKTAYYTMSNPLYMGALMAEAPEDDLMVLKDFGIKAGVAFQMSDDILCTFSDEEESGKPPMDDIREGKRTILALKTLERANKADALFFEQMLGNQQISKAQFEHCKKIIVDSGALEVAQEILASSCRDADAILEGSAVPDELRTYLSGMITFLQTRKK